ncbi:unnamed protein product [Leuciscus chuanchicus]
MQPSRTSTHTHTSDNSTTAGPEDLVPGQFSRGSREKDENVFVSCAGDCGLDAGERVPPSQLLPLTSNAFSSFSQTDKLKIGYLTEVKCCICGIHDERHRLNMHIAHGATIDTSCPV